MYKWINNMKFEKLARRSAKLLGTFDPVSQAYNMHRSTFCILTVSESEYTMCFLTEQFAAVPLFAIKQISGIENARLQR